MAYKKREKKGFSARRKTGRASRHAKRDTSPDIQNLPTMTCGEDVTIESLLIAFHQLKSPADVKEISQADGTSGHSQNNPQS